jgi:uncharacterized membrane protein
MYMMIIREELLHPLFTHFPIVILFAAPVLRLASLLPLSNENRIFLVKASRLALYIGPLSLIITIYLGDMAFEIVKSNLCQLFDAYRHEQLAYESLYAFMAAVVFDVVSKLDNLNKKLVRGASLFCFLMMIIGNYLMFSSAHLGANLVYEQGAAVKAATPKCD